MKPHRLRKGLGSFLFLVFALSSTARADEQDRAADAQLFKPAMDLYGVFTVDAGRMPDPFQWGVKAALNVANEPISLPLIGSPSGGSTAPVDYNLTLDIQAFMGVTKWLSIGMTASLAHQWLGNAFDLDNPYGFAANEPKSNMNWLGDSTAAGDLRVQAKFGFFDIKGFAMAALLSGIAPLGDEAAFIGEKKGAGQADLAFSYHHPRVMAAVNVGYVLRGKEEILEPVAAASGERHVMLEINDELAWGAGMKIGIVERLAFGLEVFGRVPLLARGPKDLPMEALAGLFVKATENLSFAAGGGAGIGRYLRRDGIKPLGRTPTWRFFALVTLSPKAGAAAPKLAKDSDGDGIPDAEDTCPKQAEDQDGFEDVDGCPDLDNDQDGIRDDLDKCPNQTEDLDGFQDADGCPDLDNDGDGIADIKDRCPNQPEDMDGFKDQDGCPDLDNDGDGIADNKDRCPDEPGPESNNGCPSAAVGPTITATKIEMHQKIFFATGKATLKPASMQLLDKVADLLKQNPQVKLIRIEGHTDSRGNPKRNLVLSQRRAEAVRQYLISKGVAPDRLQAVGYGDSRPIAPNDTRKGRAANRRVEFIIVRQ